MIGQTISHYKITEKLGEGGMGVVYKAEDTKLRRVVALKFLRSELIEDPEHRERFLREAQAAAALDHPNICTIYEIDEDAGRTFLAMAFIAGLTVKDKIAQRPLKLDQALDITIQAAQGLQAAHERGIVHRDIKSANLMVTPQGQVKIMDFGLAQLAERSKLTETTTVLGTPSYMSPEQAVGDKTDRRTDLWSLGVVLYEMVAGRLPFEGERQEAVLYGISNEEQEPVTALRAGLPIELEWIVGKALAKDREECYQHVEELIVDLRGLGKKLASGKTTVVPTGKVSPARTWLWPTVAALRFSRRLQVAPKGRRFGIRKSLPCGRLDAYRTWRLRGGGRHVRIDGRASVDRQSGIHPRRAKVYPARREICRQGGLEGAGGSSILSSL